MRPSKDTPPPADEALVPALAAGDEHAFATIVERYWERAHRLAWQVTGNEAAAEDVVQEAFVRLLSIGDRFDAERGAFRPWFFRIVQNAARNHRRARGRRRRHERAAAPEEAIAPRTAHAEQAELREHLRRLDPDVRSAVSLRYLEGMSYREVGETLGWPEGTTINRVRRGLERLRESLGPDHALAALTPAALVERLLAPVPAAPARPTSAAALADAIATKSAAAEPARLSAGAKVGAGATATVLVVAVAALLAWPRADDASGIASAGPAGGAANAQPTDPGEGAGPDRLARADAPATAGANDGPADAVPARDATADADPAAALPAGRTVLRGRIVPTPLEGAWVRIGRISGDPEWDRDDLEQARGAGRALGGWEGPEEHPVPPLDDPFGAHPGRRYPVASDGTFTLPIHSGRHLVAAGARGFANAATTVEVRSRRASEVTLTLEPLPVGRVRAQVLDAEGNPYAARGVTLWASGAAFDGASGEAQRLRATTDGAGQVALEVAAGDYRFKATEGALASDLVSVEVREGENPAFELRLRPAADHGTAEVRVVDARGEPVAGALVGWSEARPDMLSSTVPELLRFARDTTGPDGVFRLDRFRVGARFAVARHGDLGGRSPVVTLERQGQHVRTEIVLDQPIATGGVVLDVLDPFVSRSIFVGFGEKGAGLDTPMGSARLFRTDTVVRTAREESISLRREPVAWEDLPPGRYEVLVEVSAARPDAPSERGSYTAGPIPVEVRAGETARVQARLRAAAMIRCQVLSPEGEPLDRLSHTVAGPLGPDGSVSTGGGDDPIELAAILPGDYTLIAGGDDCLPARFAGLRPTDEPVTVRLPAGPVWQIEVVDERGEPVAGAQVTEPALRMDWRTDAAGGLRLRGRLESFAVSADGFLPRPAVAPELEAGARNGKVRVVLERAAGDAPTPAVIRGVVVDEEGMPVAGARVSAETPGRRAERARTQADGSFVLEEAPTGEVAIIAYRGDRGISEVVTRKVAPDARVDDVRIVLRRGVPLRGRVRGRPGSVAHVTLQSSEERLAAFIGRGIRVVPRPDGYFDLGTLPAGDWVLTVADQSGRAVARRTVTLVSPDAPIDLTVEVAD